MIVWGEKMWGKYFYLLCNVIPTNARESMEMKRAIYVSRTANKESIAPYLCGVMLLKTKDSDFFAGVVKCVSNLVYSNNKKEIQKIKVTFDHIARVYSTINWPDGLKLISGSTKTDYTLELELEGRIKKIERYDSGPLIIQLTFEEIYFFSSSEKVKEVRLLFGPN